LGVEAKISSDSMGSLRCPNLSAERKERSKGDGPEGHQGEARGVGVGPAVGERGAGVQGEGLEPGEFLAVHRAL
jgi:hypothetical protein